MAGKPVNIILPLVGQLCFQPGKLCIGQYHIVVSAISGSRFSGKPVVFFCRSGSRTQNKAELLERSASGKAYQLGGGILAWEQAGFPVWSIRELLPCFAQEPPFISGVLA